MTFLEETFSASTAPPKHRLHQKAAQAVLKALLPQSGTDIKGQMRSEAELREASGYASRPRDFDDVIGILDPELRLITPTDPEGSAGEGQFPRPGGQRYYQLTHDYLVHSLRDWLTRKQRETRRGRAELRLAERAAIWDAKPENRHLPSMSEWVSIRSLTSPVDWTDPQRRMMRRAGRVHGLRATAWAAALITLLSWGGFEVYGNLRASALVESLKTADNSDVASIVGRISDYRRWTDSRLRSLFQRSDNSSREKLNASLALLPVDPSQLPFLEEKLLGAFPSEIPVLRDALTPYHSLLIPKLWTVLEGGKPGDVRLLPAASALARYDPESPNWQTAGQKLAAALVTFNPVYLGTWLDVLRPAKDRLIAPFIAIFRDKSRLRASTSSSPTSSPSTPATIRARWPSFSCIADPKAFLTLFPVAELQEEKVLPLLHGELAKRAPASGNDASRAELARDGLAERQARAALALVRMGKGKGVWPLLGHSPDPRLRSFIVNWLKPLNVDPGVIAAEFDHSSPRSAREEDGRRPLRWRNVDTAVVDSGPGDLRCRGPSSRRARAVEQQAARSLSQRSRCRHPRGGGMDAPARKQQEKLEGH